MYLIVSAHAPVLLPLSVQALCGAAWRLVKALADPKLALTPHPLRTAAKAINGQPPRVWKWLPYVPGAGEFSVPRDQVRHLGGLF